MPHARKQPESGKAGRRRHRNGPPVSDDAYAVHNLLKVANSRIGYRKEPFTLRREGDGPVAAHEDLHAKHLLEGVDLTADS